MSSAALPQFLAPEIPGAQQLPTPSFPLKPLGKPVAPVPPVPIAAATPAVNFDGLYFTREIFDNVRAAELRALNVANQRNITPRLVERFAHDMAFGNWRETHECVAVCRSGRLGDGQNRMAAIELAYEMNPDMKPIVMWVCWNVRDEDFPVFNTGKSRTGSDVLKIDNRKNTTPLASGVRLLVFWDRMEDQKWKTGDVSPAELLDKLHSNPGIDEKSVDPETGEEKSIVSFAARVARKLKLSQGAFVAGRYIVKRAWADAPIDDFLLALESGENLGKGNPAHTMREWAFKMGDKSARRTQANIRGGQERDLRVLLNGFNATVRGVEQDKVYYKLGSRMPEPYVPVEAR